ncbi:MAG: DUF4384 domain-containing protein [Nitrospira sp.]|nr:DUF4384 domain-containing protein [Nitrospira sp.]
MPDRLMKFASLLILTEILTCLGCMSQPGTGSKASGRVASPAPVVGSGGGGRCDSPSLPGWAGQTVPLQAVGRSSVSQEDADKSARLDAIKSLEVRVDGVDRTSQQETSASGFSYSISSEVVETVHITVSGLEILQRHTDPCGPHYYALARLDRDQAVHAWHVDLKALDEQRGELSRQAATAQEQGEMLRALELWHQALEADATAEQLDRRLRYLAPQQVGGESGAARVEQTRQRMTALLTSLKLVKVSGDRQRAKPGKPLPDPLTVQVVSTFQGQERPLSEIPILFSFEVGQGEVASPLRTDSQGRAEAHVRGIEAGSGSAVVLAKVGVDHVGRTLPPALQDQLTRHLAAQVVRFSMTPPPLVLDHAPLAQALHDLALRLSAQVNDSDGALTLVQGFFENRTKERLALSARLETGLAAGLSRFGVLQVIDGELATSDPSAKSVTNREVAAKVFGVYEADVAGGLWISAKLVRVRDQVMEATAEGTIPRTAFSEQDWLELHGVKIDNRPPAAPAGSGQAERFHRWVEGFWDLRNPSGFHTELVADRPQYRIGEKAGFQFRTTADCYLTVVSIGVSGSWIVLSPNQYRSDLRQTLVRAADGWMPIPHPEKDEFEFTVDRPLGTERIKTICTKQPVALVRNMDFGRGYFMVTASDAAAIGGINWSDLLAPGNQWSEAHAGVVTLETGETDTKGSRGLKARGLVTP